MLQYRQGLASEPATLVDAHLDTDLASIEVQHHRLVSLTALGTASPPTLTRAEFTLTADDDGPTTLDVVGRRLYYFFDLIEGVRSLINVATADTVARPYAPPPVVSQVHIASPAVVTLEVVDAILSIVPWGLVTVLLMRFPSMRRDWHEGTLGRSEARRSEAALTTEQYRQELQSCIISALRDSVDTGTISDDVLQRHYQQFVLKPIVLLASSNVEEIAVAETETDTDTDTAHGEG